MKVRMEIELDCGTVGALTASPEDWMRYMTKKGVPAEVIGNTMINTTSVHAGRLTITWIEEE